MLQGGFERGPGLLLHDNPVSRSQRRVGMVERPLHSLEWAEPDSLQLLPHHRERCHEKRVGGSVQWSPDRRPVEPQGKDHAHQLPRAPSSLSGSEVFCQGQNQSDNPSEDGQHVGTDIHQQARGNNLPTAEQPGQREEHPPQSPAPGRGAEHHS